MFIIQVPSVLCVISLAEVASKAINFSNTQKALVICYEGAVADRIRDKQILLNKILPRTHNSY
jgi:hypothetical protein